MLKHPKSSSLVFYKHPNALKLNITLLTTSNEYLLLYLTKCYQMLKHPKSSSVKFQMLSNVKTSQIVVCKIS